MRLVVEVYDCDAARIGVQNYRREFSIEWHATRPQETRRSHQCFVATLMQRISSGRFSTQSLQTSDVGGVLVTVVWEMATI